MLTHRNILDFLEALGYQETVKGHCHGIGHIILQEILEGGLDVCLKRLNKMAEIIKSANESAKAVPPLFSRQKFLNEIKKNVDGLTNNEEKYDLYGYCDSVKIVNDPQIYPQYFLKSTDQSDILDTLTLVLSSKLEEKKKKLNVHPIESGIYNKEELEAFLQSLKVALDASTSQSPTVVEITKNTAYSDVGHMTGFSYDPTKKLWYFVDSNNLPPKAVQAGNEKELAQTIFDSYSFEKDAAEDWKTRKGNDKNYMAMRFSIRNVASSPEEVASQKQAIENWKKSETYQELHRPTPERVNKQDKNGMFWLDIAEGEVKKTILSKRSFASYVKASFRRPGLWLGAGVISELLLGIGISVVSGGLAAALKVGIVAFVLTALSPIGIGLMIGLPLLAFLAPFIYSKVTSLSLFNQPTIQNQNVNLNENKNEISQETSLQKDNDSSQQILTSLKQNTLGDENTLNNKPIFEEKDPKTDDLLLRGKLEEKEENMQKASPKNDNLLESKLSLNAVTLEEEKKEEQQENIKRGARHG